MQLTDGEKLILIMLADLHKKLGIKGEINPDFVKSAIFSDNLWGFNWRYQGLFSGDDANTPSVVRDVCDYLDMWSMLERSWAGMSAAERAQVAAEAAPFGTHVKFSGFDGNHEGKYMDVAKFLVDDLERFVSFKKRADLNSHTRKTDTYARMYQVFSPMRSSLTEGVMTPAQITEVLKAQFHPSHT